jgi:hypothetical protein
MRVYHFLSRKYAKMDLREQRLKAARIDELNDPFEILSCSLGDPAHRRAFTRIREKANDSIALLCFSNTWDNPLMWSHYAEKHEGVCFGFDVPDWLLREVQYTKKRDDLTPEMLAAPDLPERLLLRKYADWAYEKEVRWILPLKSLVKDGDKHFMPFGPDLSLVEVIIGPRCDWPPDDIWQAWHRDYSLELIKARMAFRSFRIVMNRRGFSHADAEGIERSKAPRDDRSIR